MTRMQYIFLGPLTTLCTLAVALSATGADYVVTPYGSDSNPGSLSAPFATLAQAASVASPGDTVLLRDGSYPAGMVWRRSGIPGRPILLKARGDVRFEGRITEVQELCPLGRGDDIYAANVDEPVAGVAVDLHTSPLVVEGLARAQSRDELDHRSNCFFPDATTGTLCVKVTRGGSGPVPTLHVLHDAVGLTIAASHVIVDGLACRGFARAGIQLDGCTDVTVRNCRVTLCGFPWGSGIGLHRTQTAQIRDCVVWRVMNGILLTRTLGTFIDHNTVYATRAHGVMLNQAVDTIVRNNVLFAGGASGSTLYVDRSGAEGLELDYNCYLDFTTRNLISWMPAQSCFPTFWDYRRALPAFDRHSVSADPLLIDTTRGREDLRLHKASPCREAGEGGTDMGARPASSTAR